EPARENAGEGLVRVQAAGYRFATGLAKRALGQIAWASGDAGEAAGRLTEALHTFIAIGARYFEARTRLELAPPSHVLGRRIETRALLDEARGAFLGMNVPRWAERADQVRGELKASAESRPRARGATARVGEESAPG